MADPLIFNIVRSSVVDGPGVRTTVFFKGCNLDCAWCHNPEGKEPRRELLFFAEKCIGCGACRKVCGHADTCVSCGECAKVCPAQARKIYGRAMSVDELFAEIAKDKLFYDACGGGVTFSGGECMLYPDFLAALAEKCQKNGIGVAVDTAGAVPFSSFLKVMPAVDVFLYDIKCITSETHERFTGKGNALILENFEKLLRAGAKIIVRVPQIQGFNDGAEAEKIRAYLADKNVPVEYLPYHDMGVGKQRAILAAKTAEGA